MDIRAGVVSALCDHRNFIWVCVVCMLEEKASLEDLPTIWLEPAFQLCVYPNTIWATK